MVTLARRGNSLGGAVAALPRRTVGAQAAAADDDPRYPGNHADGAIRRDRIAWYPTDRMSGVGSGTVSWSAAGPPRPELHMRNVTVRRMAGTSQTRALTDPRDRSIGLHTKTPVRPMGNLTRYADGRGATMRPGRTDRLSPAVYTGQSYSQTTLMQGAAR